MNNEIKLLQADTGRLNKQTDNNSEYRELSYTQPQMPQQPIMVNIQNSNSTQQMVQKLKKKRGLFSKLFELSCAIFLFPLWLVWKILKKG